jgi:hypothetical protein
VIFEVEVATLVATFWVGGRNKLNKAPSSKIRIPKKHHSSSSKESRINAKAGAESHRARIQATPLRSELRRGRKDGGKKIEDEDPPSPTTAVKSTVVVRKAPRRAGEGVIPSTSRNIVTMLVKPSDF